MRCFDYSLGPKAPEQESGSRVVDDISTDAAIAAAELDAIEAFLSAEVRAIIEGTLDSEKPKTTVKIREM